LFLADVPGLSPRAELLRELSAWRLVLPEYAAFTHITAGWLHDWWLPRLPEHVPVFAVADRCDPRPRRAGLVCSRLERSTPPTLVLGLPVEPASEVLLRAARDLSILDLVVMLDSALRLGTTSVDDLDQLLRSRRPGVRRLRKAVDLSDPRSESPGETLLRIFHRLVAVLVEPQCRLYDNGRFVGRGDLVVTGTNFVHEYDGSVHLDRTQQSRDLRRARRLAEAGYVRRGYTLDDLVRHPAVMLAELDRALGRPHQPARLHEWRRMLAESSYTKAGRNRLQNRWLRATHHVDWSRTT
jgi:very-short-patch-repair endonuclease